jgi:hypothetical protein
VLAEEDADEDADEDAARLLGAAATTAVVTAPDPATARNDRREAWDMTCSF